MKSMAELDQAHADVLAGQRVVARCVFCPAWRFDGTAADGLEAAREHRASAHPEIPPYKRRGSKMRRPVDDPTQRRRDSERRRAENHGGRCGTATRYSFGCRCGACCAAWAVYGKPA